MEAESEASRLTRVIWSFPARDDIFDILDYYDAIDPALADDIAARIDHGPTSLLSNPSIGSPVDGGYRKWRVRGTPFLLFYVVRQAEIEIRRVRHYREHWRDT